jgi:hypothetical protein
MSNPCSFPAIQLLRLRRRIAETTTIPTHEQARLISDVDEMRHDHLEHTGCQCWRSAIAAHPNLAQPHPRRIGPTGVPYPPLVRKATR